MAGDPQREKARAIFGTAFFENTKQQEQPKNAAAALQKRANARPIPTYKVGGVVKKNPEVLAAKGAKRAVKAEQDFSKPLREAVLKAAAKGTPVMKEGGPTDEYTAKRVRARMETGNYKDGGKVDRYDAKIARKREDIEKDYQKALAKGKNADVAKAKYEQRMADAADDYAKWTKADRSQTSAAEKAAERALSEARRTKGQSIRDRDAKAAAERTAAAEAKKAADNAAAIAAQDKAFKSDFDATFAARKNVTAQKAAPVRKVAAPVRRAVAPKAATSSGLSTSAERSARQNYADVVAKSIAARSSAAKPTAAPAPKTVVPAPSRNIDRFSMDKVREVMNRPVARSPLFAGEDKLKEAQARAAAAQSGVRKYAVGGAGKVRKGQAPMKKGK